MNPRTPSLVPLAWIKQPFRPRLFRPRPVAVVLFDTKGEVTSLTRQARSGRDDPNQSQAGVLNRAVEQTGHGLKDAHRPAFRAHDGKTVFRPEGILVASSTTIAGDPPPTMHSQRPGLWYSCSPARQTMVTFARCPIFTDGISVSSTSSSASTMDMSATVSSWVPALFIVPTTTFSPSSMLRRVTMPSNGALSVT